MLAVGSERDVGRVRVDRAGPTSRFRLDERVVIGECQREAHLCVQNARLIIDVDELGTSLGRASRKVKLSWDAPGWIGCRARRLHAAPLRP
jgi:hypothetical protein